MKQTEAIRSAKQIQDTGRDSERNEIHRNNNRSGVQRNFKKQKESGLQRNFKNHEDKIRKRVNTTNESSNA